MKLLAQLIKNLINPQLNVINADPAGHTGQIGTGGVLEPQQTISNPVNYDFWWDVDGTGILGGELPRIQSSGMEFCQTECGSTYDIKQPQYDVDEHYICMKDYIITSDFSDIEALGLV